MYTQDVDRVSPAQVVLLLPGATATMGLYPLETLRTRLAMGDYDNMLHAVRLVTAEEGPWAFYQVLLSCAWYCSMARSTF